MKKRRRFLGAGVLAVYALMFVVSDAAKATSETATVTAYVTAKNISVALTTNGSVDFQTINLSSHQDTTSGGVNDTETAQNDGNVDEDFNIKATTTTAWTLVATPGANQYSLQFCITDCDGTPTWNNVGIDPSYATLASDVVSTGTQAFDLRVGTPSSSASYTQQTITVTIQAVAATP